MTAIADLPDIRPSLLLDFANSGRVDPRIECTRASAATCFGPDGKLRVVPAHTPRIDYDPATGKCLGLLVEEARTNIATRSTANEDIPWAKTGIDYTYGYGISPDGSKNSVLATSNVTTAGASTYTTLGPNSSSVAYTAGVSYTGSVYLKFGKNTSDWSLRIQLHAAVFGVTRSVILSTSGEISAIGSPEAFGSAYVGDGWYRIWVSHTAETTGGSWPLIVWPTPNMPEGDSFEVWGAQIEAGSFPTSYIPTEGVAVTRAADVLQIAGTSFSSWYRQDEGTVFGQAVSRDTRTAAYARLLEFAGSTTAYKMTLARSNAATRWNAEVVYEGVPNIFGSAGLGNVDGDLVGLAYKRDDFASASRGNPSVREAKSGEVPGITRLILGGTASGTGLINGHISKIAYYPKRLTNAQLQRLTA